MANSDSLFALVKQHFNELVALDQTSQQQQLSQIERQGILDEKHLQMLIDMLQADKETGFATQIPGMDAAKDVPNLSDSQVGSYRLIKALDRGGMGQVYLAERNDGHFQQTVALKLPHMHLKDKMHERFETERQILAQLNHENIARLLDGGSSKEGQPFLAMEYIDGLSIDKYCIQNLPSLRQRIELVIQICQAIAYAHQNLVLHRDIKPGNILVTAEGQVKLLDFGIAKLLDLDEESRAQDTETRIMTRSYASPEQLQGQTVSTHSDIFSIAVIAYELITGFHPFKSKTELEREQNLISGKVQKVSQLTEDSQAIFPELTRLNKGRIIGDLENILIKALSISPQRRYSSAQALADDLENYLNHRPVTARKPSSLYTFIKLIQRNKSVSVLSVITVLALVLATMYSFHKAEVAEQQRQLAVIESEKSKQISDFLQNLFVSARPAANQQEVTIVSLLDHAVEELAGDESLNNQSRFHLLTVIFQSYVSLEKVESLKNALEGVYQQCVSELSATEKSCIEIKYYMARYKLEVDEDEAALDILKQVEQELKQHHKKQYDLLARTLINQFTCFINLKDFEQARLKAEEAFRYYEKVENVSEEELIGTKIDVAYSLVFNKKFDLANQYIDALQAQLIAKQLQKSKIYSDWLILKAVFFSMKDQPAQAVIYRQQSVDMIYELFPDRKPESFAFRVRALANLYFRLAQLDLAAENLDKAIVLFSTGTDGKQLDLIQTHLLKGLIFLAQGHDHLALQEYVTSKSLISAEMKLNSRIKCQSYFIDAYLGMNSLDIEDASARMSKYEPCSRTRSYNYYNTYWSLLNVKYAIRTSNKEEALRHLQDSWKLWDLYPENHLGVKKHVQWVESEVKNKWPDLK